MSILTKRLAKEILEGIEGGYVQPTDDTANFIAMLKNGDDIIEDFTKPTIAIKGGNEDG